MLHQIRASLHRGGFQCLSVQGGAHRGGYGRQTAAAAGSVASVAWNKKPQEEGVPVLTPNARPVPSSRLLCLCSLWHCAAVGGPS